MQVQALLALPLLASAAAAAIAPNVRLAQIQIAPAPPVSAAQAQPVQTTQPVIQYGRSPLPYAATTASTGLSYWYSLRQNERQPFSTYATFLLRYRGWPGETGFRRKREAMSIGACQNVSAIRQLRHYATGHARYASLYSIRQMETARAEAREAWRTGALTPADESRLLSLFHTALTAADHDAHIDVLLNGRDASNAYRLLGYASPARRQIFETRIALQGNAIDVVARVQSLGALAAAMRCLLTIAPDSPRRDRRLSAAAAGATLFASTSLPMRKSGSNMLSMPPRGRRQAMDAAINRLAGDRFSVGDRHLAPHDGRAR